MHPYKPLQPAAVSMDDAERLYSTTYGDIYHARAGALEQARQVFLRGNRLPERWRGRDRYTVCETGFGIGLNFLALWSAWREDPRRPRRLHMLSIEGHPFDQNVLRQVWRAQMAPALQPLAERLAAQWPPLLPGLHRLEFEQGAVTLTLAFGPAQSMAQRLSARVDAYFFDGFAPDRNPDMWSPALFADLARLAAPGATLASWTSAGHVRRALSAAGFAVRREPGFGGKREMIVGELPAEALAVKSASSFSTPSAEGAAQADDVLVIGAGLAGAGIAQALALRGCRVTVLAPDHAAAHRGHLAAALTPLIARDDDARARLARAGSRRALQRWAGLDAGLVGSPDDAWRGADGGIWRRCGTLHLERAGNLKRPARAAVLSQTVAALQFPSDWVRAVDADEASSLAGLPVVRAGVFFADGLLVRPDRLIAALLARPGIACETGVAASLAPTQQGWRVSDAAGRVLGEAPTVVLANAAGAREVLAASGLLEPLPMLAQMHALAGEVALAPSGALRGGPRCIVGGDGYLLPAVQGWCVAGSTYVHGAAQAHLSAAGRAQSLGKAAGLLGGDLPEILQKIAGSDGGSAFGARPGWAGWRAVLPGRLPAVGAVPHAPGLWLATGYASRGLAWSALAGDVIAASLMGEPLPLETDLLAAVAPR